MSRRSADRSERREQQDKAQAEYKRMTRSLASLNRNDSIDKVQETITEHFHKTEQLYPVVKKRLPGSAADAKHLKTLLHLSSDTAKRINATARPFELKKFIQSMRHEHGDELFEFVTENYANRCLRIAPSFEFFYGRLRLEALEAKERRKRTKVELGTAAKSTTAVEKNLGTDVEQDTTPKEVELIYQKIKRVSDSKPSVGFFDTIVDSNSFTQTVENIFHVSFLIKESKLGIRKSSRTNEPVLTVEGESRSTQDGAKNQSILSFTMADFNRWKRKKS